MNQPGDAELRDRFSELRRLEGRRAPEFRTLWIGAAAAGRVTRRRRVPALLWLATAAGVVLATGVAIRRSHDRNQVLTDTASTPWRAGAAQTISTWRSPTEGFLRMSGSALLGPPSILSSILDGAAPASVPRKGD